MSLSRALAVTATAAVAASATVIVLTTAAATVAYVMVDLLTASDKQRPQARPRKEAHRPSKHNEAKVIPSSSKLRDLQETEPSEGMDGESPASRRRRSNSSRAREKMGDITCGPAKRSRSDSLHLATNLKQQENPSPATIALARAAVDHHDTHVIKSSHPTYFQPPSIVPLQDDDFILLAREPSSSQDSTGDSDLESGDELDGYFSFPGSGAVSPAPLPDYLQPVAPVSLDEVLEKLMVNHVDRSVSMAESEAPSEKSWTTAWQ